MFALTRLLTALSALADNLNRLAGPVAEVNGGEGNGIGPGGPRAWTPLSCPAAFHTEWNG
jgi:hypothetical protein